MNTLDEREIKEFELNLNARNHLSKTAPWLYLLGIIGLIFTAFILLGLLAYGGLALTGNLPPNALGAGIMSGIMGFYAVYVGIMFYCSFLLLTTGSSYKRFIATGQSAELEKGLNKQRIFWMIMGVTTIVGIGSYFVFIAFLITTRGTM